MRHIGVHTKHVGDGQRGLEGCDDGARGEHLRDRDVIQTNRVGDEIALGLGDPAGPGGRPRQTADFDIAAVYAGVLDGRKRVVQPAEPAEQERGGARYSHEGRHAAGKRETEVDADLAREHDRGPCKEKGSDHCAQNGEKRRPPTVSETGEHGAADQTASQQGAQSDEGDDDEVEGGQGVTLVGFGTIMSHRGLGILRPKLFQLGMGERGDDSTHEGEGGGEAVQEREGGPERPGIHRQRHRNGRGGWRGRIPALTGGRLGEKMPHAAP